MRYFVRPLPDERRPVLPVISSHAVNSTMLTRTAETRDHRLG